MKTPIDKDSSPNSMRETIWTRGAWLTLFAATLFIALNIAQVAYRFTIPSLGWAGPDPDTEELDPYFQLDVNAVGAASPIRPGEIVQAIDGITAAQVLEEFPSSSLQPANWEVGEGAWLTVVRDGQAMEFDAPIVHWTLAAWRLTNLSHFRALWNWLVTLLLFGVVAFTFLNRPGNLAARFLFAFGLAYFSITLSDSIPDYIAIYFDIPAGVAKAFFSNIIFAYLLGPSFLGFALTFPRPKPIIQRHPRWLLVPYLVGSITIVLLFTVPELAVIGFLLTFVMLLLGVVALIHTGFTTRDAISRAQLRWAVGGVTLGVAIFMLNFASFQSAYRDVILNLASLGFPIIGISLAIAILRYRLFDIDIIIRKTLQYVLLTGLLALVYFGSVVLLQSLFETLTGGQSPIVIVISTLAIAVLFNPLRLRVQDFIDRRFFRKKYDAERTLAKFATVARDEVDMDKLTAALLGVVEETMQPEGASLWLKASKRNRTR